MGQCPYVIPNEKELKKQNGMNPITFCLGSYNIDETSKRLSKWNPERFLVKHLYDSINLIPKETLEKVFEQEYRGLESKEIMKKKDVGIECMKEGMNGTRIIDNALMKKNGPNIMEEFIKHSSVVYELDDKRKMKEYHDLKCGASFMCGEYDTKQTFLHLTKYSNLSKLYRTHFHHLRDDDSSKMKQDLPNQVIDGESTPYLVPSLDSESTVAPTPPTTPTTPTTPIRRKSKSTLTCPNSPMNIKSLDDCNNANPIHLYSNGSSFLNLVLQGSLGLMNGNGNKQNSNERLFLMDSEKKKLIALCCLHYKNGIPNVTVFSTSPKSEGQYPTAQLTYNKKRLYRWAEITTDGKLSFPLSYFIYLTDYRDTMELEPRYVATHTDIGNPTIQVVGRTQREHHVSGCCLLSFDPMKHHQDFSIIVARGLDPTLFICLSAFVDEHIYSSMMTLISNNQYIQ